MKGDAPNIRLSFGIRQYNRIVGQANYQIIWRLEFDFIEYKNIQPVEYLDWQNIARILAAYKKYFHNFQF